MSIHFDDELGQKDFTHTPNVPSLRSPGPLALLDHQLSLNCPHLRVTTLVSPPLNNPPLRPALKCDDQTTISFSTIYNCRAPHITLSILTEAIMDYRNATDANNMGTLNQTVIPHYDHSYFARSASGRKLLKTNAHISICHPSLSRRFEAIFRTMTTFKTQKTQITANKIAVTHRIVKSGILDGLEG